MERNVFVAECIANMPRLVFCNRLASLKFKCTYAHKIETQTLKLFNDMTDRTLQILTYLFGKKS